VPINFTTAAKIGNAVAKILHLGRQKELSRGSSLVLSEGPVVDGEHHLARVSNVFRVRTSASFTIAN
jgi:hypothetical protein